jgi:beta-lactamase superfamily II metal-dependent hydrolase
MGRHNSTIVDPTPKNQTTHHSLLFTCDIGSGVIRELNNSDIGHVDVLEPPHHGEWSPESKLLVEQTSPHTLIQSTNIARHKNDVWKIPQNTERFNTAVDGTITLQLDQENTITVLNNHVPVSIEK